MAGEFILGVDLDGVCGDYTSAFRAVVAEVRGVDPGQLGDNRSWSFTEWGIAPEDWDDLHRTAVLQHRIYRTMAVMPGTAETLWRLSDAGVWIRIITHRLCVNWGHAVAVADTVDWLDVHGIPYRDICFLGDKPQVEADCYVEDGPHNVVALREAGNEVIVFDQPYNRELPAPRASSWSEVEDLVATLAVERGVSLQGQFAGFEQPEARLSGRLAPNVRSDPTGGRP